MLLMDNTISNPLNSQQLASSNVKTHSVEGEKYVVANKTSSQPAPEETDSPVDDTASLDSNSSSKKVTTKWSKWLKNSLVISTWSSILNSSCVFFFIEEGAE